MKSKIVLVVLSTVLGMLVFSGCASTQESMTQEVQNQMEAGEGYDKRETNEVEQQVLKGENYDRKETNSLN